MNGVLVVVLAAGGTWLILRAICQLDREVRESHPIPESETTMNDETCARMVSMSDIVERLQRWNPAFPEQQPWGLLDDAVAEIERLQVQVQLRDILLDADTDLADVLSELAEGFADVRDYPQVEQVLARYREARQP